MMVHEFMLDSGESFIEDGIAVVGTNTKEITWLDRKTETGERPILLFFITTYPCGN